MDAETARFLTENTNDNFNEEISFSDEDIPPNFIQLSPNKTKSQGASKNRKKLLSTAPSIMKLIEYNTTNDSSLITPTIIPNDYNLDNNSLPRGHGAQGSVVEEILSMQIKSLSDDDDYDIQILAKQAAKEFKILCKQNDELYHKKELIKQKYDDQKQIITELNQQISNIETYKMEIETLKMSNEKYITQIMVLEEEKQLYQQQIQELQHMNIKQFQNDININIQNDMQNNNNITNGNGNEMINTINNNNINNNNEFLQQEISTLSKENQQLLLQNDNFKIKMDDINDLKGKLKDSEIEVSRLSAALTEQQNNYIELEQIKQEQIDKLTKQTTDNIDDVIIEYQNKEKEYLQTIQTQQTMIDQLSIKNEQLDEERASLIQTKSDTKFNLTRLKTDVNLFHGDTNEYDESPFGVSGSQINITTSPLPDDEGSYSEDYNIDNEKEIILKLQTELTTLKQQMSHIEESEQSNINKLLAIADMGQSNNDILKQQFETQEDEEIEYEEIEEEVEIEVTDDEDYDTEIINIQTLNKELHQKEQELINIKSEKQQIENKMNNAIKQNEELLHHVEEMESILTHAHNEKENLNKKIHDMEYMLKDKRSNDMNEVKNNEDKISNEIGILEQRKEELENIVNDFVCEYEKLKAKHTHDRKRFEKDSKKVEIEIVKKEGILSELESQIEEYEELIKLSEEYKSRNDAMALNLDMVNSLNITICKLQDDISTKSLQLKQEKDGHFETLDKFSKLRDQMDMLNGDLKIARKSSVDTTYRNENRIEQLENTIIELNSQIKEEHDRMKKSKSVIMSLRNENREFEEELMKLSDQMVEEQKHMEQQRRMSIQRMNDVVKILENNEENKYVKESHINNMKRENDEITQQLTNLAKNIANNKKKWNDYEKKSRENINRLENEKKEVIKLLENERNVMESVMNAKVNTLNATNKEMEELRKVIKSQQIELVQLKNKGMFDDLWSWT